jgi:hypothetical protein
MVAVNRHGSVPMPDTRDVAICRIRAWCASTVVILMTLCCSVAARACDLALVLAIDVSVSVDAREYALQMTGIARALRDPEVIAVIEAAGPGGIAVTVVEWSSFPYHAQTVGWTRVSDRMEVAALAEEIEHSTRQFSRFGTGIGNALAFSSKLFNSAPASCKRRVIDVSGDGRNNELISPSDVRTRLVERGIQINGLAVLDGDSGLADYYRREVIGGSGSFVIEALVFEDFAEAMKTKLLREILPALSWHHELPALRASR